MVASPIKGTRFRPLSLNIPKPLFPLAGQPMVHHPIFDGKKIFGHPCGSELGANISNWILRGAHSPSRYLKEDNPHGSAGGLYNFRDLIMEDSRV